MDATSGKQLVVDAWDAFATRDPDRVRAVFAPDAEWLAPPGNATALALGGTHHLIGRDRIVQFLVSEFGTVFVAGVSLDFRGFYADGDVVVVEVRMQATLAHGGHYDNDYCFIFELGNGLVTRVREYMDTQRGAAWFNAPGHGQVEGQPRCVSRRTRSGLPGQEPARASRPALAKGLSQVSRGSGWKLCHPCRLCNCRERFRILGDRADR